MLTLQPLNHNRIEKLTFELEKITRVIPANPSFAVMQSLADSLGAQLITNLSQGGATQSQLQDVEQLIAAIKLSPLFASDMTHPVQTDPWNIGQLPQAQVNERFDILAYNAALDYYGLPQDYNRIFAKRIGGEGLEQITPEYAAETNRACWLQVNETASSFPVKKPSKADITRVRNIQLDFEYPADPKRCHAVGVELNYRLAQLGYIPTEGLPIVEDSGAGCHLVFPVVPFDTTPLGGGDLVSRAVGEVVKRYFEPEFNRIAKRYHLDKSVKLDAFEISRVLSVPGTWRPYNPKKDVNAAPYLLNGYLRRWLPPYTQGIYPQRRESQVLTDLVKAECLRLQGEIANPPNIEKRVIVTDANLKRVANYLDKVLQTHCERISNALSGERHMTAYTSAKVMGGHLTGSGLGVLDEFEIEHRLLEAKLVMGGDKKESLDVIRDGIAEGKKYPLYLEDLDK